MSASSALTAALGAGDIDCLWGMQESSGTTIDDAGGNSLDLTIGGTGSYGTLGGTSSALEGSGYTKYLTTTTSGGTYSASRSVSAASTLDPVDAFTIGVFAKITSFPTSGTPEFFGRSSLVMGARLIGNASSGSRRIRAALTPSDGFPTGESTILQPYWEPPQGWALWAITFSRYTGEMRLLYNGDSAAPELPCAVARATSTNSFGVGGQGYTANFCGLFFASRELGPAWAKDLAVEAGLTLATDGVPDPDGDDADRTTPTGALEGGHVSSAEGNVTYTDGRVYRLDQHAAGAIWRPQTFKDSGDTPAAIADQAVKLGWSMTLRRMKRTTSAKLDYVDGSGVFQPSGTVNGRYSNSMLVNTAVAATYAGIPRATSNYALDVYRFLVEDVLVPQMTFYDDGSAISFGGKDDRSFFPANDLAFSLLLVRNHLTAAELSSYKDTLEALLNCVDSLTTFGDGIYTSEHYWYTNGNYEVHAAVALLCMAVLTGLSSWWSRFDRQWGILTTGADPDSATIVGSDLGDAATAGYGLKFIGSPYTQVAPSIDVTGVSPSADDYSDAVGCLTEHGSSTPGLDWDYAASVQCGGLHRAMWIIHQLQDAGYTPPTGTLADRELNVRRCANTVINGCIPRIGTGQAGAGGSNPGAWHIDATNGARHSLVTGWPSAILEYMHYRGDRDLSEYEFDFPGHWQDLRTSWRTNINTVSNANYWRIGDVADFALNNTAWRPLA